MEAGIINSHTDGVEGDIHFYSRGWGWGQTFHVRGGGGGYNIVVVVEELDVSEARTRRALKKQCIFLYCN